MHHRTDADADVICHKFRIGGVGNGEEVPVAYYQRINNASACYEVNMKPAANIL